MSDVVVGRTAVAAQARRRGAARRGDGWTCYGRFSGLAAMWLLDGVLQFQPFMYTKAFAQMLASSAAGNPAVFVRRRLGREPPAAPPRAAEHDLRDDPAAARPWHRPPADGAARARGFRGVVACRVVAWRRVRRRPRPRRRRARRTRAGGGPGRRRGVGAVSPVLRDAGRQGASAPFVAARAVGERAARALWLVLWLSLAYFALTPANRAPGALSGALADAAGRRARLARRTGQERGLACRRAWAGRLGDTRRGLSRR